MTTDSYTFVLTWHWWYVVPLFFVAAYLYVITREEDTGDTLGLFILLALPSIVTGLLAQYFK